MPSLCDLKSAAPEVLQRVLACNQADVAFTSPLDLPDLQGLIDQSLLALAEPASGSFLLALGPQADYASPNYRWFQQRLRNFAYVDRIVVAESQRGQGLARRFYEALEARSRAAGLLQVAAEVNSQPNNPGSHAFHQALGYKALCDRDLSSAGQDGKHVRYYLKMLT